MCVCVQSFHAREVLAPPSSRLRRKLTWRLINLRTCAVHSAATGPTVLPFLCRMWKWHAEMNFFIHVIYGLLSICVYTLRSSKWTNVNVCLTARRKQKTARRWEAERREEVRMKDGRTDSFRDESCRLVTRVSFTPAALHNATYSRVAFRYLRPQELLSAPAPFFPPSLSSLLVSFSPSRSSGSAGLAAFVEKLLNWRSLTS